MPARPGRQRLVRWRLDDVYWLILQRCGQKMRRNLLCGAGGLVLAGVFLASRSPGQGTVIPLRVAGNMTTIELTPVLVALMAWLVRGDPVTGYHIVGAIIILTGITLTRLGRRPRAAS